MEDEEQRSRPLRPGAGREVEDAIALRIAQAQADDSTTAATGRVCGRGSGKDSPGGMQQPGGGGIGGGLIAHATHAAGGSDCGQHTRTGKPEQLPAGQGIRGHAPPYEKAARRDPTPPRRQG